MEMVGVKGTEALPHSSHNENVCYPPITLENIYNGSLTFFVACTPAQIKQNKNLLILSCFVEMVGVEPTSDKNSKALLRRYFDF